MIALLKAASRGGSDVKKEYIEHDNRRGITPLSSASELNHPDVVATLIGHGADVDCEGSDDSRNPLYVAAMGGHEEVIKKLLEARASRRVLFEPNCFIHCITGRPF